MQDKKMIDNAVASIVGRRPNIAAPKNFGHRMAEHRANRASSNAPPAPRKEKPKPVSGKALNAVTPPKTSLPHPARGSGPTDHEAHGTGPIINFHFHGKK